MSSDPSPRSVSAAVSLAGLRGCRHSGQEATQCRHALRGLAVQTSVIDARIALYDAVAQTDRRPERRRGRPRAWSQPTGAPSQRAESAVFARRRAETARPSADACPGRRRHARSGATGTHAGRHRGHRRATEARSRTPGTPRRDQTQGVLSAAQRRRAVGVAPWTSRAEAPRRPFAPEALGRKMAAVYRGSGKDVARPLAEQYPNTRGPHAGLMSHPAALAAALRRSAALLASLVTLTTGARPCRGSRVLLVRQAQTARRSTRR